jgi:ethanolamine utilization microcompartment shell protein EutS
VHVPGMIMRKLGISSVTDSVTILGMTRSQIPVMPSSFCVRRDTAVELNDLGRISGCLHEIIPGHYPNPRDG